jgi:hypothetical protein
VSALRRADPAFVLVVAGDSFFSSPAPGAAQPNAAQQASLKAQAWVEIMRKLKVDVVAPGPEDFERGTSALVELARRNDLAIIGTHAPIEGLHRLSREAVVRVGPRRVALVDGEAKSAAADLTVTFVRGEQDASRLVPGADIVIHTGLDPSRSLAAISDGALHVSAGRAGEELLVLELWPHAGPGSPWQFVTSAQSSGKQNRVRVEHHRLASQRPRDPEVRRLLDQLFSRINASNRALAVTSLAGDAPHSPGREPPAFMGARTCAACHTQAYFAWRETPHARAYQTLVTRGRELDLDCIGCHVTGFDRPRGAALGHLDELLGVGCESCHGPGEVHADNPRVRLRSVQRAVPEAECRRCHDPEHSDGFDYREKRQRLLAPGHGLASVKERD